MKYYMGSDCDTQLDRVESLQGNTAIVLHRIETG